MALSVRSRAVISGVAALIVMVGWAGPAAAATPTLLVVPAVNLVDLQTVSVQGNGFPQNIQVGLIECAAGATAPTDQCDTNFLAFATTDSSGSYTAQFTVGRLIRVGGTTLDCAPSNCELFSSDLGVANVATAPLEFDPTVPPPPTLTLAAGLQSRGSVNLSNGEATITGTVTCSLPADVFVEVLIVERIGRLIVHADLLTEVSCASTVMWTASGGGLDGILKAGQTAVTVMANGFANRQSAEATESGTVHLTPRAP
jgi:hypothetical protein